MNRRHLIRLVFAACVAGVAATPCAQQSLEIIPLRHRTVEQVLPSLQPLLEPGGALSGSRGQLILRASPGNAADIKRALAAIDRPARRLQLSVRFDDAGESERRRLAIQGGVNSGDARVGGAARDSMTSGSDRVDQRLQVLEGSEAVIFAGYESGTGVRVRPQVSGSQVLLDVAPETPGQRIVTTVSARLGEWVELGGTASAAGRDVRGLGGAAGTGGVRGAAEAGSARSREARRVWVRVDEVGN